ncbi:MAG: thiamine-monophosphate kinase [Methylophagaceae bacterium]|jgi:thiamine-monophosphate kinase
MSGLSEFSLIKQYFEKCTVERADVLLGIGDDCALVQARAGQQIAISVDTLVEGIHFLPSVEPESLGHKSLAVSLSDLAAMGATPAWFTLALTLPEVKESWLADFAKGMSKLANRHSIALIGGDTTRGPLSITIQVHGFVKAGEALRRSGAKVGDGIYVSGTLGDAGAGLKLKQSQLIGRLLRPESTIFLEHRLERPTPRVKLGKNLLNVANSAIDISDGLIADLGHILHTSGVGAEINIDALPISKELTDVVGRECAEKLALYSGDDYELCFTLALEKADELLQDSGVPCTKIGIVTETGDMIFNHYGQKIELTGTGYEHFSSKD